jgi:hypothetical protein
VTDYDDDDAAEDRILRALTPAERRAREAWLQASYQREAELVQRDEPSEL